MLLETMAQANGFALRVGAEADAWGTIRSLVEAGEFSTIVSLREITDSMTADKIVFRSIVEPTVKNVFFLIAAEKQSQEFDRDEVFNGLVKIRASLRRHADRPRSA